MKFLTTKEVKFNSDYLDKDNKDILLIETRPIHENKYKTSFKSAVSVGKGSFGDVSKIVDENIR